MSFLSMLQMAKGKEQPASAPNNRRAVAASKPKKPENGSLSNKDELYNASKRASASSPREPAKLQPSAIAARASRGPVKDKAPSTPVSSSLAKSAPKPGPNAANPVLKSVSNTSHDSSQSQTVQGAKKKLSFKDMMKQASSIDKSKFEMNLKVSNKQKQERVQRKHTIKKESRADPKQADSSSFPAKTPRYSEDANGRSSLSRAASSIENASRSSSKARSSRSASEGYSAPFAQPSAELKARLEKRKKEKEQSRRRRSSPLDDDDLSDFVVSEEEEEIGNGAPQGRSEIWSLYNRRPKYSYADDYDSADEMEATGRDIFDEERRSTAQARREDVEEERRLEELARKKKLRRG